MTTNNLFANVNNGAVTTPVQTAQYTGYTAPIPQQRLSGVRIPFGYVVTFNGYTATGTAGTLGVDNTQNIITNPDSSFEVIKQLKYDTGGGNGYIKVLSNQNVSIYGVSNVVNNYNGYANINTVFGNSDFYPQFEQPLVFPPSRQMSLAYADITGTSGNLTLLYFGNKVYPNNSLYAGSSYIRATVPTGSYPKQYPVTLVMSQALGTASATISIPQGQNFVWTGVAINDSAYPVAINFTMPQMSGQQLFSSNIISRMISGTSVSNAPANGITLSGVRPFMFPSYLNLVENSSVVVSIQDFLNKSNYNTDITLYGYITAQANMGY